MPCMCVLARNSTHASHRGPHALAHEAMPLRLGGGRNEGSSNQSPSKFYMDPKRDCCSAAAVALRQAGGAARRCCACRAAYSRCGPVKGCGAWADGWPCEQRCEPSRNTQGYCCNAARHVATACMCVACRLSAPAAEAAERRACERRAVRCTSKRRRTVAGCVAASVRRYTGIHDGPVHIARA